MTTEAREIATEYLQHQAREDGHDAKAIKRLLADDLNMRGVWKWLSASPLLAQTFVVAALQAYAVVIGLKALPQKGRAAYRARFKGIPGWSLVFESRKSGNQSDFLRLFIHHLLQLSFPVKLRGAATQIAAIARVLLGGDIDVKHVSKLIREQVGS